MKFLNRFKGIFDQRKKSKKNRAIRDSIAIELFAMGRSAPFTGLGCPLVLSAGAEWIIF